MSIPKRLLIVEDDTNYLNLLQQIYSEVLPDFAIIPISSGTQAIRLLESLNSEGRFGIISLDINLRMTHSPDTDISQGNGVTLLRIARKKKACNAMVVVSGIYDDDTVSYLEPDPFKLEVLKTSISRLLREYFGENQRFVRKPSNELNIKEIKEILKNELTRDDLLAICKRFPFLYKVDIGNPRNFNNPDIRIQRHGERNWHQISNPLDGQFVYAMIRARLKGSIYVSYEDICRIYDSAFFERCKKNLNSQKIREVERQLTRKAHAHIQTFQRRLERLGIEPRDLFDNQSKLGYYLQPDTET